MITKELVIKKNIYIYGTGGHSKVITDIINSRNEYAIEAYIDDGPKGKTFLDRPVIDSVDIDSIKSEKPSMVIAIGENETRKKIAKKMKELFPNITFPSLIHVDTSISPTVKIMEGSVVMPGSVINHSCVISEFVIINSACSLDHDCEIGEYSSLAPGTIVGGCVKVGSDVFVGLGAHIINNLEIGKGSIVGAGSLVLNSIGPHLLCYGRPAKIIRKI